jgi:dTDP-4-amino-4,6-dideoxy-D-glucose acyltransferase
MGYYTETQLLELGFKSIGENVLISDKASIYGIQNISIGSNVRIDDFCIISAGEKGIFIGDYVHIACYTSLIGSEKIVIGDYCGISARCSIYSSSDDYSGEFLFGPTINEAFKKILTSPVTINDYSIIGVNSVVLPGVEIGKGVAIGALSLVNKSLEEWYIYVGCPVKKIKPRKKDLLQYIK